MPNPSEFTERHHLLQKLRESGNPAAVAHADALDKSYHDEQMALLSDDVYDAAREEGRAPHGWARASENLPRLRELMPLLASLADAELREYLKPGESGFRAEIYLPDPAILGPGYKPTVAIKGSSGEVMTRDGLRSTTWDDFGANNGPQAVGMRADYYDRGMRLAQLLKRNDIDHETTGHSLGGGVSTAMSAVTGQPATTFNAANLHPNTASRFVRENGGEVYDVSRSVTAYHVDEELLNPIVQDGIRALPAGTRAQIADVLQDTARVAQDPVMRRMLVNKLPADMPQDARTAVLGFLDHIADNGAAAQALRGMPLPSGTVIRLDDVKGRDVQGALVDRREASLRQTAVLAQPLLDVLDRAADGARLGQLAGVPTAANGRIAARALDGAGDIGETALDLQGDASVAIKRTVSTVVQAGIGTGGELAARAREQAARAEAAVDRLQGGAQATGATLGAGLLRGIGDIDWLPDAVQRGAREAAGDLEQAGARAQQRNAVEAANALREGRSDAAALRDAADANVQVLDAIEITVTRAERERYRAAGDAFDAGLDAAGGAIERTTRHAPGVGAGAGGIAGGGSRLLEQVMARHAVPQYRALLERGGADAHEALERHLMTETVVPTIEARIDTQEATARRLLQSMAPAGRASTSPAQDAEPSTSPRTLPATSPTDPTHPDHRTYNRLRDCVGALDAQTGKAWDGNSERLCASVFMLAKQKGFTAVDDLRVAFNLPTDRLQAGELVHLYRVGPDTSPDPFANRAHMRTEDALLMPADARYQQAQDVGLARTEALHLAAQQEQARHDEVARSARVMTA